MRHSSFLIIFLLALMTSFARAADPEPAHHVHAKRIEHPPVIDGNIGDDEWKDVPTFSGLIEWGGKSQAPFGGKFWIAYDRKFIYFAAKLQDSNPSKIVNSEYRSGSGVFSNDFVVLAIDPFGKFTDFNNFYMNPSTANTVEIAGGRAAKKEWLGEFVSKGRITSEGWEVEGKIPWGIMRLPKAGVQDVRFQVIRYSPQYGRDFPWQDARGNYPEKFGRWIGVEIPPTEGQKIKVLPYTFVGSDQDKGTLANSGVDVRVPVTDTLDFVGSVNPDFRNVENSVLGLSFSYFERLAGESRPFFLEGRQYFNTSGDGAIFTSQRIQRFDLGTKVVGKLDPKTNIGIFNALSYGSQDAFVAKIQRRLRNSEFIEFANASNLQDGKNSEAHHFQYQGPLGHNWTSFFQLGDSRDTERGYGHRLDFGGFFNKDNRNGSIEYYDVSPDYNPRLGFSPERNFKGFAANYNAFQPEKKGFLVDHNFYLGANHQRLVTGGWYNRGFYFGASGTLRKIPLQVGFDGSYNRFLGNNDKSGDIFLGYPRGNNYTSIDYNHSWAYQNNQYVGGDGVGLSYRLTKKLQTRTSWNTLTIGGDRTDQLISSISFDMGGDRTLSGRLVKQGSDTNAYLSFQRSGANGLEYYLIFGDPNAPTTKRSIVLKLVMPFETKR